MWETVITNTCPCGRVESSIEYFADYEEAKEKSETDDEDYCSECFEALENGWTTVEQINNLKNGE